MPRDVCDQELRRRLEVVEAWRIWDLKRLEDGALSRSGLGALGDLAVTGLHGHEVHAVELASNVAPGVADSVLCYPKEK